MALGGYRSLRAAFPALLTLCAALAANGETTYQFRFGVTGRPLEGRRYQTMRALAHYLDERAQYFSGQVFGTRGFSTSAEKKLLSDVSEFARRADHFHDRMDNYADSPYDVPSEVLALERRAQAVSTRLQQSPAYRQSYDEWNDVLTVLDLMKRSLAGEEVRVPQAHAGFRDYDRDYEPFREPPPAPADEDRARSEGRNFSGPERAEFVRLARDLDELTNRIRSRIGWIQRGRGSEGDRYADELYHFNDEIHLFRMRIESGNLDSRDHALTIGHLIEDARRIDDWMRRGRAYPELSGDWAQVIERLNRLSELCRS